jgi:bifunctional DNA-binding transcriptional regulator/antitoxin component of YhaV-PrlF toxin-antitoxin module
MTSTLTPRKTDLCWAVEIPPEIAEALGVAEGSVAVFSPKDGKLEVSEILPPASPELKEEVREIHEQFKEAFEEMKRLGD